MTKIGERLDDLAHQLNGIRSVVNNLVHEMEILKQALVQQGSLSPEHWNKCFSRQKQKFLLTPKGNDIKLTQRYQYDGARWIQELFPDIGLEERRQLIKKIDERE